MREMRAGFEGLREALASHGLQFDTEDLSPSDVVDVVAELDLPNALVDLYLTSAPIPGSWVPWVVEDVQVFSIRELSAAQEGYRWTGSARAELPSWPRTWVVVAAVSGDPFIADVSDPATPIWFARHGVGSWEANQVAPDMAAFIEALARFEEVLLGQFQRDIWSENVLRPEFLETLEATLAETLSPAETSNFLDVVSD